MVSDFRGTPTIAFDQCAVPGTSTKVSTKLKCGFQHKRIQNVVCLVCPVQFAHYLILQADYLSVYGSFIHFGWNILETELLILTQTPYTNFILFPYLFFRFSLCLYCSWIHLSKHPGLTPIKSLLKLFWPRIIPCDSLEKTQSSGQSVHSGGVEDTLVVYWLECLPSMQKVVGSNPGATTPAECHVLSQIQLITLMYRNRANRTTAFY